MFLNHKEEFIQSEKELSLDKQETILKIEKMIDNKQIPETYPSYMINNWSIDCFTRRDKFISKIGFVLLSWNWLNPLSEFLKTKRCLEVMAGTGSLTYFLKQLNVDVKATDDFSWNKGNYTSKFNNYWIDIENIDAVEAVKKYGNDIDVILISWAYMDDIAYNVLQIMREINPNCEMIFIGESCGGCTASDNFFESAIEIENNLIDKANDNFQQWRGIHDYIQLVK